MDDQIVKSFYDGISFGEGRGEITLFHGSKRGLDGKISHNHHASNPVADFGQGFYLGTKIEQARTLVADCGTSRLYVNVVKNPLRNAVCAQDWNACDRIISKRQILFTDGMRRRAAIRSVQLRMDGRNAIKNIKGNPEYEKYRFSNMPRHLKNHSENSK